MANKVLLKKSSVVDKVPVTGDLDYGELALNYADGKLYFKNSSNNIKSFLSSLGYFTSISSNTTAVSGNSYLADTTAGTFTLTLPASPANGDMVVIADAASFGTNPLTVGRNSSTIANISEDLSLNIDSVSVTLVYDGSTWEVFTQLGARGGDLITSSSNTTFTNKTISGSSNTLSNIGNASLTNSSVTINGTSVSLGGSGTVTAAAGTLTGSTLASGVTASSLTSVGTLTSLSTSGAITSTAAATTPTIESRANVASYANNATVDFPNFSGVIIINRQDGGSGNVALWIVGGGAGGATKLGDSAGNQSGTIAVNGGVNGYTWTNNTGGTISASFMTIRTRDGA